MSLLEFEHVSYQYPGEDFDIIDDLSKNVLRASEYVETRTLSSTGNCAAYSLMASETLLVRVFL